MQVYDIKTTWSYGQIYSVVADSMAEAERVFGGKYWPCTIKEIVLHSEYVQIQKFDEQNKSEEEARLQQAQVSPLHEHDNLYMESDGTIKCSCGKCFIIIKK